MNKHKLILIDGIPGSGKSTLAQTLSNDLINENIKTRFYHELEENHPLFIYERKFNTFKDQEESDYFYKRVLELFDKFVDLHFSRNKIVIVESILFQDTLCFSYNMGMAHTKIAELFANLAKILGRLNPVLIFYYQMDVRKNWSFISEVRGPEWHPSLRTEEGLDQAQKMWSPNQDFMRSLIDKWDIPKLVIENKDYLWDQNTKRSKEFLRECSMMPDNFT